MNKKVITLMLISLAATAQVSFAQTSKWLRECEEVVRNDKEITQLETRTYEEKGVIRGDILDGSSSPAWDYSIFKRDWIQAAMKCFHVSRPIYPEDLERRYFPSIGEHAAMARIRVLSRHAVTSKAQQAVDDSANQQKAADERTAKLREWRERDARAFRRVCTGTAQKMSADECWRYRASIYREWECRDKVAHKLRIVGGEEFSYDVERCEELARNVN